MKVISILKALYIWLLMFKSILLIKEQGVCYICTQAFYLFLLINRKLLCFNVYF